MRCQATWIRNSKVRNPDSGRCKSVKKTGYFNPKKHTWNPWVDFTHLLSLSVFYSQKLNIWYIEPTFWRICMVNVGESPYIEHLRLKSSGSSGGSKTFWASIFAVYFVGRKTISQPFPLQVATFGGRKGTSCSRGEITPVTTHAIYRWNHSISKNDGANLVLPLMKEILSAYKVWKTSSFHWFQINKTIYKTFCWGETFNWWPF